LLIQVATISFKKEIHILVPL